MASKRKPQPLTFGFRDLTVWSTKLPDVKFAVLPPSNTRPNPLATEDRLYVSVFSPGAVCALERDRGKLIWRRELHKYANASTYLYGGRLFAKTANTLFALQPDSGETLWSFSPYGTDPSDPRTLEQLCAQCGAGKRTIERLFITETGMTFGQWRRQLRLLHALQSLACGEKVSAAAMDAGYNSASAFISMFRKHMGETPSRYFKAAEAISSATKPRTLKVAV